MRSIRCQPRLAGSRRALLAGMAIVGILLSFAGPAAAATAAHRGLRRVTYLRHSFEVPRGWPVIDLRRHPRTCVRFDRHAIYLGSPPSDQACPSMLVGTTEAMLIAPDHGNMAHVSVENPVARQITVTTRRLDITATFGSHPAVIERILANAHLPRPVTDPADPAGPDPQDPATVASLPPAVTNFRGFGFDTCAAPSEAVMADWQHVSPYQAVGIYIGGSDRACAQPNLTPSWLRAEAAAGWHFIPMYVGPQAAFGELTKSSASQGAAAATDAVHQAEQLGFGPLTPLYYDMEGYLPGQSGRVLRFFSAWTTTLHKLGYSSGIYSSSSSGVADLAHQFGRGKYAMPDVIFDALWNGQANTDDPVFGPGEWVHHHRLHQYRGNLTRTYGGATMDIDRDLVNVELPVPPTPTPSPTPTATPPGPAPTPTPTPTVTQCAPSASPPPTPTATPSGETSALSQAVTEPDGTVDVFFRGTDGGLWYLRHVPGQGWTRPVDLGGQLASEPSAVAVGNDRLKAFYQGVDGVRWVVRSRPGGWSRPVAA